jgi:hypothetical protein
MALSLVAVPCALGSGDFVFGVGITPPPLRLNVSRNPMERGGNWFRRFARL